MNKTQNQKGRSKRANQDPKFTVSQRSRLHPDRDSEKTHRLEIDPTRQTLQ